MRAIFTGAALVVLSLAPQGLQPTTVRADDTPLIGVRRGLALHGQALHAPDTAHFPYVNPSAPKGGRMVLGVVGSFDSLNPLIVKGVPAFGMRDFAIESLMARAMDEPFSLYPLLAESYEMPDDRSAISFKLNPKAAFSDGKPVTADDVLFSFEALKTKGRPNHRTYFAKVTKAERLSDLEVKFTFDGSGDREIPLILGLMPIVPRHEFSMETFDQTTLQPFATSGPYKVSAVDPGRSITYTRNPDYWGRDLAINRGRFNFDEVRWDYFREGSVVFETFRRGQIDFRSEDDPALWAQRYDFPAMRDGRVKISEFEIAIPAGMTGLVFNTRRDVFKDARVRRALIALFDFEWVNKNLFNGLFRRTESFFERSALSSAGKPADETERRLLAPFADAVRPEFLKGSFRFPHSDGSGTNRTNQRAALELLKQAGLELKNGRMVNTATSQALEFEILAASTSQEGLLLSFARSLEPLGIKVTIRTVDSAQYQARLTNYDYDMIQWTWNASLSPGNEQLFRWSAGVAKTPGSYNYAGVENPAADAMIKAMLAAETREEFVSAVRALDRVLLSGDYVIPLYHLPKQWTAHWRHLAYPPSTPLFGYNLDSWWVEGEK